MSFIYLKKELIYRLININPLLLISTISKDKKYNIAPIAWGCPQEINPPRLLICIDTGHKTFENIVKTKKFVACIPGISQLKLVKNTGSMSGKEVDKFKKFNIKSFTAPETGCKIPDGIIGYLENKVFKIIKIDTTAIVIGNVITAAVNKDAFDGKRLLAEKKKGKVIYHLGKNKFITTGNIIYS